MTKSTITREQLQQIIETDHVQCGEASSLARIALASLEAEPVAYIIQDSDARSRGEKGILRYFANISDEDINEYEITVTPLYTAPPAPVSVPDALVDDIDSDDHPLLWSYSNGWNACRAAMLQSFGNSEQLNSPVIPDGWTCNDKANAALMMLDRIETVDPVDDDRIDGIKRIVRELAAAPHDTPALNSVQSVDSVADRWIPVSERMPIEFEAVIAFDGDQVYGEAMYSSDDGFTIDGYEPCDRLNLQNVTHWMPLPADPEEVKSES